MKVPRETPETSLGSILWQRPVSPWKSGSLTLVGAVTISLASGFCGIGHPKWPKDSLNFQLSETIAVLSGGSFPLGTKTSKPADPKLWDQEAKVLHPLGFLFFLRFFFFFLMWTIFFKVLVDFVTILLLFYVLVFLAVMHVGSP